MLRNLTPQMRTFSMGLYGWLGCITLETCEAVLAAAGWWTCRLEEWLMVTGLPN